MQLSGLIVLTIDLIIIAKNYDNVVEKLKATRRKTTMPRRNLCSNKVNEGHLNRISMKMVEII